MDCSVRQDSHHIILGNIVSLLYSFIIFLPALGIFFFFLRISFNKQERAAVCIPVTLIMSKRNEMLVYLFTVV